MSGTSRLFSLILLGIVFSFTLVLKSPALAAVSTDTSPALTQVPGELIVKLKEGASVKDINRIAAKHGLRISQKAFLKQSHPQLSNVYNVKAGKDQDLFALLEEFKGNSAVEYAEPKYLAYTQLVPTDPLYPQQWSHQRTKAESGWDMQTGSPDAVIAVVDTGVYYNHQDLAPNIWRDAQGNPGRDFVDIVPADYINAGYQLIDGEDYQTADNDPSDYYGHGTHVAGIAAAAANNGVGVAGVCPGCKIMPLRAGFAIRSGGTDYGLLEMDDIVNAILYAVDNGARVINMSFGGSGSQLEKDAINYADSHGVVLVAAAGNNNQSFTKYSYPAAYDNVLAVASTSISDSRAWNSNYGFWIDVAAPGGDTVNPVLSTVPLAGSMSNPSGYKGLYGTSMASAYIAGVSGLLLSKSPGFTNKQVMNVIRQGVAVFNVDLPDSPYYLGTGLLDVYKAVRINSASSATAVVSTPSDNFILGGRPDITGSTSAPFRVVYGAGIYPAASAWTELRSGPATTGLLATLDSSMLPDPFNDYTLKLIAEDQDGKVEDIVLGQIGKHFLAGWPQIYSLSDEWVSPLNSPNMADIDNDGFGEIIIAGRDTSYSAIMNVFKKDGTQADGWPYHHPNPGTAFAFGAAAGDLDNDGNTEIVASAIGSNISLMAWDRWGKLLWSRIPEPGKPTMTVTLGDINGDGKLEIITKAFNSKLHVLDHEGNTLWSYPLNDDDSIAQPKTVAVADFDRDGKKEIVKTLATKVKFDPGDVTRTMGGSLILFNHDGTIRWKKDWPEPGEPLTAKYYQIHPAGSPVVGDINGDGSPDIMVKALVWKGDDIGPDDIVPYRGEVATRFYAFDAAGAVLPGWPVTTKGVPGAELALADLNSDGFPELVGSTIAVENNIGNSYVHAITFPGHFLFPSVRLHDPQNPYFNSSNPSLADVTGDGAPDILVFGDGMFHVIDGSGTISTLPVKNEYSHPINTPILTDLDKNGTEDLVFFEVGYRPVLWAWDLMIPHNAASEQWALFASDAQHTGCYRCEQAAAVTKIGIVRNGIWYLDKDGTGAWDPGADSVHNFGVPADMPVMGNWDGSQRTGIGVYRSGTWFLDSNGSGSWDEGIDSVTSFGIATDDPVTGDWDGFGKTKIGVYRSGTWFLDMNGNGAWDDNIDAAYFFGIPTDIPVTGDWNGDGKTEIGVYRQGAWYLDMNGNGSWDAGDTANYFGIATDRPVTGDWTGDGKTKIGVYRGGTWYLDLNGNGDWDGADSLFVFGISNDIPVTGRW